MSDKTTTLIERDRLSELVLATARPEVALHTVPRNAVSVRAARDIDDRSVSPIAVLLVLGMLIGVFVAIVQL